MARRGRPPRSEARRVSSQLCPARWGHRTKQPRALRWGKSTVAARADQTADNLKESVHHYLSVSGLLLLHGVSAGLTHRAAGPSYSQEDKLEDDSTPAL